MPQNIESSEFFKGERSTKNRKAIIDFLNNEVSPVTAEEIYSNIKKINQSLCLSTVYRTLEKLSSKGHIIKLNISNDNKLRYKIDKNVHEHYLMCIKCNKIVPVMTCAFDQVKTNIQNDTGFEIISHDMQIYGHCKDCKSSKK